MKTYIKLICSILFVVLFMPEIVIAQGEIPLQGTYNFRDIGGCKTVNGRHIKKGKLYRSALLNKLTAEDIQILCCLNIRTIVDFRGPKEIKMYPDTIPQSCTYVNIIAGSENDEPDDWQAVANDLIAHTSAELDSGAVQYYRNIKHLSDRYRPLFAQLLLLNKDSSLVFHCAGGKDRTGIAAALIEYVLGVDSSSIMADYMLTNEYRKRYNSEIVALLHMKYGVPMARAQLYGIAKAVYLNTTFEEIKKQYGSIDNYIFQELRLDATKIKQLRDMFLD